MEASLQRKQGGEERSQPKRIDAMKISITAKTTAAIMVSTLLLVLIGTMLRQQTDLEMRNSELVDQTERVISQLDSLYAALIDLEHAENAYLLEPAQANRYLYDSAVTKTLTCVQSARTQRFAERKQEAQHLAEAIIYRITVGRDMVNYNRTSPDFKDKQSSYLNAMTGLSVRIRGFIDDLKHYENGLLLHNQQGLKTITANNILSVNTLLVFMSGMLMAIWLVVVRYVSERQRAENNLRRAEANTKAGEALMRSIVETAPDGIITIARGGTIESTNAAMEQIFGYSREELVGHDVSFIIQDFIQAIAEDSFQKELQTGESELVGKDKELVGMKKDGTTIPVELAVSVLNLGTRQILNAVMRDITERKEVEKRVSEFYATVSHELRTPLTSIRTALGLMESGSVGKLPSKAGQLIRIARSECDRLIRLINDILDIRKIESGKLVLRLQSAEPSTLIDVTFNGLRSIARESGIRLTSDIKSKAELQCDVDRIVQVLTNLVSNAIRFSPRASSVTVRVERSAENGAAHFSVIDTGPGIPPDQMHKLWDRFQQLEPGEGKPKGGSGLGLAISKAIVAQHGGAVGVESSEGQGSTFWFELPERTVVEQEPEPGAEEPDRRRILLINDDEEVHDLLNGLLSTDLFELIRATTGADANRLVSERRPDIVLLDIQLADGNGFDMVRNLVLDTNLPPVPIIVLPGREPTLHTLGNPVLLDWLIKPIDEDSLRRSLLMTVHSNNLENAKALVITENTETFDYLEDKLAELNIACLATSSDTTTKQLIRSQNPSFIVLDIQVGQQVCFDVFQYLRQEKARPIPLAVYADKVLQNEDLDKLTL
ncbi:MAG TPA: ATP-binding protein, partial [Trichormus sp.]